MDKRNIRLLIALGAFVVIVIGAYALFHGSTYKTPSSSSSSSTNQGTNVTPVNNAVFVTKSNTSVGQYLADPSGNTLYTYGGDTNGASNCTGSCLASWPAYQYNGSLTSWPTQVGSIKRADNGEMQFTYKGKPLYTFVGDTKGQVTGNGVADFSVARP